MNIGNYCLNEDNQLKKNCNFLDKKEINNQTYLLCNEGVGENFPDKVNLLLRKGRLCSQYDLFGKEIITNKSNCSLCNNYNLLK